MAYKANTETWSVIEDVDNRLTAAYYILEQVFINLTDSETHTERENVLCGEALTQVLNSENILENLVKRIEKIK